MLSRRHPDERTADARAADLQRAAGLLLPRPSRRRSGRRRRHREGRRGQRPNDRRTDQCAALFAPAPRDQLQRALHIEALSPGWRASFEALLRSPTSGGASGNAGLAPSAATHPAAPGFRPLAVTAIDRESADVISLTLQSAEGTSMPIPLPGQYVVLRLRTHRAVRRCFAATRCRTRPQPIDIGSASRWSRTGPRGHILRDHVHIGDVLDVSSPRGSFVLQPGDGPIVLLSAGIGATPVLAMLHALVAAASTRPVLWLHGARDREHHAFAAEVRALMRSLAHGRSHVCYSQPGPGDEMGRDFDAVGTSVAIRLRRRRGVARGRCVPLRPDALHGGDEARLSSPSAWHRTVCVWRFSTAANR